MVPLVSRIGARDGGELLGALATALGSHGLNLIGTTPVEAYDARVPAPYRLRALVPEARSAIVVGNGGGAFWQAFKDFSRRHPSRARGQDPVDGFTRHVLEEVVAAALPGDVAPVLYPFRFPADPVSFMHLAECAGLGRRGLVGVLIHPTFGPWIALRAAILVPFALAADRPADGF